MSLEIQEVITKSDLKKFINTQWEFYRNDPNWVAPLKFERKELLNQKKNPFFSHSQIKHWVATNNGLPVGRISAIINGNHNQQHEEKTGFFGFFECEKNQNTANALFQIASAWLKKNGMKTIRGPVNPSTNDEAGLLIDGFDSPPVVLMTYNPDYYAQLIENAGLSKVKDLFAYKLDNSNYKSEKLVRLQSIIREKYTINIRAMDFKNKNQFRKDVDTLREIYNTAWEKNWGFVKMTNDEFDYLAKNLKTIADPDYTLIAEINGKPIGFVLGLPDINQSLISNKSGNLLIGVFHLLTKKSKIDTLRIIVLGLIPEYRNKGIDSVLYHEIGERSRPKGIKFGEASWILEDNEPMNRAATQIMHGELYKKYRIYEAEL